MDIHHFLSHHYVVICESLLAASRCLEWVFCSSRSARDVLVEKNSGRHVVLQEQTNSLAAQLAECVNRLQRDAPPVPPKGKALSQIFREEGQTEAQPDVNIQEQTRIMATDFVRSVKLFDTLVDLLPMEEGGEDAQLQKIAELQRVNEEVGDELAMELQKTDEELHQLRSFFHEVADECFKNQGKD